MNLIFLQKEIRQINEANGWVTEDLLDNVHSIPSKLALIHSEVSEALEAYRKHDFGHMFEELADVIIRVLDLTAALNEHGISNLIDEEIARKLRKNSRRGYKHGGKRV